jgi:hypothetical protein
MHHYLFGSMYMFSWYSCCFLTGLTSTPGPAVGRLAGIPPLSDLRHNLAN